MNTTNPGFPLDVNGTINATSFRGDGSQLTNLPIGGGNAIGGYGSRGQVSKNNATTPNTQYDLKADVVILYRASKQTTVVRHNPGTIINNISTGGPAANGRDQSGVFAASACVHFYWIWNGTTLATISSLTPPPTGPILPGGGKRGRESFLVCGLATTSLLIAKHRLESEGQMEREESF